MRRRRLWIAAIVMWSLTFAQLATAAHACSMLTPGSPQQSVEAAGQPMQPGCADAVMQSDSTANACVSHCFTGQQVHGQADVPSASIAPQPALAARVTEVCVPAYFTASSLAPLAAAPPPLLRFSRFLI